jgi:hypothetical protein
MMIAKRAGTLSPNEVQPTWICSQSWCRERTRYCSSLCLLAKANLASDQKVRAGPRRKLIDHNFRVVYHLYTPPLAGIGKYQHWPVGISGWYFTVHVESEFPHRPGTRFYVGLKILLKLVYENFSTIR